MPSVFFYALDCLLIYDAEGTDCRDFLERLKGISPQLYNDKFGLKREDLSVKSFDSLSECIFNFFINLSEFFSQSPLNAPDEYEKALIEFSEYFRLPINLCINARNLEILNESSNFNLLLLISLDNDNVYFYYPSMTAHQSIKASRNKCKSCGQASDALTMCQNHCRICPECWGRIMSMNQPLCFSCGVAIPKEIIHKVSVNFGLKNDDEFSNCAVCTENVDKNLIYQCQNKCSICLQCWKKRFDYQPSLTCQLCEEKLNSRIYMTITGKFGLSGTEDYRECRICRSQYKLDLMNECNNECMICKKCWQKNLKNSNYCPSCGNELEEDTIDLLAQRFSIKREYWQNKILSAMKIFSPFE